MPHFLQQNVDSVVKKGGRFKMEKGVKNIRKLRAAVISGALAAAIVLTGSLAWLNMSQKTVNELMKVKNPGGRFHDDLNGEENKDIYAENFTDKKTGSPVFARVRLLEYMEIGEEAGINRTKTVTDEETGEETVITDPDRKATPLVPGADINDTTTWRIHKPDTESDKDPFHDYWTWEMGGSTVYMPTFNKNKDSISVDINGTYVGPNKVFDDLDPYEDYVTYMIGGGISVDETAGPGTGSGTATTDPISKKTAFAYYDADSDNDIDENFGVDGKQPFTGTPGAGGIKKDPTGTPPVPKGNYEEKKETHEAQSTLNGLGYITMADWKAAGMPVCNKWVWDVDGWFYWPEPIMPQTATGLLLDKLTENTASAGRCYYAVAMVGQFVDGDKTSWGAPVEYEKDEEGAIKNDPTTGKPIVATEPTGFYIDGITDDAVALLDQAKSVKVVAAEKTVSGKEEWYLPVGGAANIFRQILNDEGKLGGPIWAGPDKLLGTADDRAVTYVEDGVSLGDPAEDYGHWFLTPRTTPNEPYYTAPGPDGVFGTTDDVRLWLPDGKTFPEDVMTEVADTVTISAPAGVTELAPGRIEAILGTTLGAPFTATVTLGGTAASDQAVTWSVAAADGSALKSGTKITQTGVLSVDPNETAAELIVTATSELDDRYFGTYKVKISGKPNVRITVADTGAEFTSIQAGTSVKLKAWLYHGDKKATDQPDTFTWSNAFLVTRSIPTYDHTLTPDTDTSMATLTVGRGVLAVGQKVTFDVKCEGVEPATTITVPIIAPAAVTLTATEVDGKSTLEIGDTLTFQAAMTNADGLATDAVTWEVGTSNDGGVTITSVTGMDIDLNNGVVTLDGTFRHVAGQTYYAKATAADPTTNASGYAMFTVELPVINVTPSDDIASPIAPIEMDATVTNGITGQAYHDTSLTWTATDASGNTISGVTIDRNTGKLTVDKTVADGTQVTVTATSAAVPNVTWTKNVTAYGNIPIDGSIVTYDGIPYIVLAKDTINDRMLIITQYTQGAQAFGGVGHWDSTPIRTWLNNDGSGGWLYGKTELQAAMKYPSGTTIKTRSNFDSTAFTSTTDKVFLLSEADCFGTFNNDKTKVLDDDYTAGGKLVWTDGSKWICLKNAGGDAAWWTLRNPCSSSGFTGGVSSAGVPYHFGSATPFDMRPALWVKIP